MAVLFGGNSKRAISESVSDLLIKEMTVSKRGQRWLSNEKTQLTVRTKNFQFTKEDFFE